MLADRVRVDTCTCLYTSVLYHMCTCIRSYTAYMCMCIVYLHLYNIFTYIYTLVICICIHGRTLSTLTKPSSAAVAAAASSHNTASNTSTNTATDAALHNSTASTSSGHNSDQASKLPPSSPLESYPTTMSHLNPSNTTYEGINGAIADGAGGQNYDLLSSESTAGRELNRVKSDRWNLGDVEGSLPTSYTDSSDAVS